MCGSAQLTSRCKRCLCSSICGSIIQESVFTAWSCGHTDNVVLHNTAPLVWFSCLHYRLVFTLDRVCLPPPVRHLSLDHWDCSKACHHALWWTGSIVGVKGWSWSQHPRTCLWHLPWICGGNQVTPRPPQQPISTSRVVVRWRESQPEQWWHSLQAC